MFVDAWALKSPFDPVNAKRRKLGKLLKPCSVLADLSVSGIGCRGESEDHPRELCGVRREDDGRGLTHGRRYE